jgi:Cdc6-like AAA superfamily ATPase
LVDEGRGLNTLIITGKPGAGKSLLVNTLLNQLAKKQQAFFDQPGTIESKKAGQKKIEVLQFNAMSYSQCFPLMVELVAQVFERANIEFNKSAIKNGTYLLELFKNKLDTLKQDHIYVILIDELDTLAKHDQKNFELINDLLNIPDKEIVKIGISNTLDLFAKYKNTKKYVESRQMAFKPYGEEELWGILKERLDGVMFIYTGFEGCCDQFKHDSRRISDA